MTNGTSAPIRQLAWSELVYARYLGLLTERFEGAQIGPELTPVFDINGEVLFHRVPFDAADGTTSGYADIATNPTLGETFLALSPDTAWNQGEVESAAISAAQDRYDVNTEELDMRFVAFSYPKLAAQFLADGEEVLMLELYSWEPVPPAETGADTEGLPYDRPSNRL